LEREYGHNLLHIECPRLDVRCRVAPEQSSRQPTESLNEQI